MYFAWPVLLSNKKTQLCGHSGGNPALRKSGVLEQDSRIFMNSRLAWAQQWHSVSFPAPKRVFLWAGYDSIHTNDKLWSVRYKDGKFEVRLHSTGTSWPLRYISSLHTTNPLSPLFWMVNFMKVSVYSFSFWNYFAYKIQITMNCLS